MRGGGCIGVAERRGTSHGAAVVAADRASASDAGLLVTRRYRRPAITTSSRDTWRRARSHSDFITSTLTEELSSTSDDEDDTSTSPRRVTPWAASLPAPTWTTSNGRASRGCSDRSFPPYTCHAPFTPPPLPRLHTPHPSPTTSSRAPLMMLPPAAPFSTAIVALSPVLRCDFPASHRRVVVTWTDGWSQGSPHRQPCPYPRPVEAAAPQLSSFAPAPTTTSPTALSPAVAAATPAPVAHSMPPSDR